jgi:hypothetical protein
VLKPRLAGWIIKWCRGGYQPPVITVKNVRNEVLNIKIGVGVMGELEIVNHLEKLI